MVDINLHQVAENDLRISKKKSVLKSGMFTSILLLGIIFSIYGIVVIYKNILVNKRDNLTLIRTKELSSFDLSEINKIIDFQYRIDNIVFNIKDKKSPAEALELVEKFIVKGSFLSSYSYDAIENKIKMKVVLNSFRLGANQILSLKKSGLFEDVRVIDSGRNSDEQAVFELEAYFKN